MSPNKKIVLVTGAAGFIGSAIAKKLLSENCEVIGIDNINDYYDVRLKIKRLDTLKEKSSNKNWQFFKTDLK